jgi:hypothetical protein
MNVKRLALIATFSLASTAVFAQANAGTINQRKSNQQARIAQGVRSGELSRGETARLEHQERSINREERAMRAQNGGRLTRSDRQTLARQQNQESRRIARDKHNSRVRS